MVLAGVEEDGVVGVVEFEEVFERAAWFVLCGGDVVDGHGGEWDWGVGFRGG